MRRNCILMGTAILLILCHNCLWVENAKAVELTMYCNPIESQSILASIQAWEKKTGNKVTMLSGPAASSDVLALYQQQLTTGNPNIDLYEVEVVWAALLGSHFVDLKPYTKRAEKIHIPSVIESNTSKGRLVAMPLYIDVGMVFYRKDLLKKYTQPIPETWQELVEVATHIVKAERAAGNTKLWGLVFQGRAYEGLTCCAIEWIHAFGGGTIIDSTGTVTVNNPNAVAALKEAASWIGTITPKSVLHFSEEEARGFFQSGNAVFMRSWPYAWGLGEAEYSPIKGKIGIMPVPKGSATGNSAGVIGGWSLAVSKYSKNQRAATDLLLYITGKEGQQHLSKLGNYVPSLIESFSTPRAKITINLFQNAISRPAIVTGAQYQQVSSKFYTAVHAVLSGKMSAEKALSKLELSLQQLGKDGWD